MCAERTTTVGRIQPSHIVPHRTQASTKGEERRNTHLQKRQGRRIRPQSKCSLHWRCSSANRRGRRRQCRLHILSITQRGPHAVRRPLRCQRGCNNSRRPLPLTRCIILRNTERKEIVVQEALKTPTRIQQNHVQQMPYQTPIVRFTDYDNEVFESARS